MLNRELLILDLARSKTGFGPVPEGTELLRSPTCGDEVAVHVELDRDIVRNLTWKGHGCTVSTASSSALAALAPGRSVAELRRAEAEFVALVLGPVPADDLDLDTPGSSLGDAVAFAGIGRLPLRAGCAMLAWRALDGALQPASPALPAAPPSVEPAHYAPHRTTKETP